MPPGRPSSTVRQVGVGINIGRIEVNDKSGKGTTVEMSRTIISRNDSICFGSFSRIEFDRFLYNKDLGFTFYTNYHCVLFLETIFNI